MTQQEILKLENLKVAEIKPNMFLHIHSNDGYVITSWFEGDDIKNYSGSICYYMPIMDNYDDNYRVITSDEHERLEQLQREAFEKEQNIA